MALGRVVLSDVQGVNAAAGLFRRGGARLWSR
jgi:hypothetical protein